MSLWYSEAKLAAHLGVTREALLDFRKVSLKKRGDWKKDGREIFLAPMSVQKLLEKLGQSESDLSDCLQQPNGQPPAPELLELTVNRVFPNPHLIECLRLAEGDAPGQPVQVRVQTNKHFRKGMIIKARPDPTFEKLYRLEGRCPRFPGKW